VEGGDGRSRKFSREMSISVPEGHEISLEIKTSRAGEAHRISLARKLSQRAVPWCKICSEALDQILQTLTEAFGAT
jgi:hypothetical protein